MDELCVLRELVAKLEDEHGQEEQIQILQQINTALLTQYAIRIDNLIIKPLWVEAYYCEEDKFSDHNSHKSEKQKYRFGQLYFHEKGRGGLDICLSAKECYFFSVLIKASLVCVDGYEEFKTQTEIYDILNYLGKPVCEIEKIKNVMILCDRPGIIRHIPRKGLTEKTYKNAFLASVPIEQIKKYPKIKLPTGYSRTEIIKEYIYDRLKENPSEDEMHQLQELAVNLIAWKNIEQLLTKD